MNTDPSMHARLAEWTKQISWSLLLQISSDMHHLGRYLHGGTRGQAPFCSSSHRSSKFQPDASCMSEEICNTGDQDKEHEACACICVPLCAPIIPIYSCCICWGVTGAHCQRRQACGTDLSLCRCTGRKQNTFVVSQPILQLHNIKHG